MSVHFKVPFEVTDDGVVTVKHGSLDEVTQNVAVILGTRAGERLTALEFGISDPTFRNQLDVGEIEGVCARFEPRAQLTVEEDPRTDEEANVTVKVGLR